MATTKQKKAARQNIKKAQKAQSDRAHGKRVKKAEQGLSTAQKNRLPKETFAFPDERKEPLSDAKHVRNAIARFDQVEGVTDAERDKAWKRIRTAAKKYDVDVSEKDWRDRQRRQGQEEAGSLSAVAVGSPDGAPGDQWGTSRGRHQGASDVLSRPARAGPSMPARKLAGYYRAA